MTAQLAALGSVVIPAHNESGVIRRCLDALFAGIDPAELDVVVVCNGCTDDTAAIARASGHPVRVLDVSAASKTAALRAGDDAVAALPRLYLDADVVMPGPSARAVLSRLRDGAIAARPPIRYDAGRASWLVRSYYRARCEVPAVQGSLWGAGVYGLSAAGRGRFGAFPDVVGDDLWVDGHFARDEVEVVDCEPVVVAVPRRSRDLVRILRRTYRGKAEGVAWPGGADRSTETTHSTLRDLARAATAGPRAAADVLVYAGFATYGRVVLAVASPASAGWERDDSSRSG